MIKKVLIISLCGSIISVVALVVVIIISMIMQQVYLWALHILTLLIVCSLAMLCVMSSITFTETAKYHCKRFYIALHPFLASLLTVINIGIIRLFQNTVIMSDITYLIVFAVFAIIFITTLPAYRQYVYYNNLANYTHSKYIEKAKGVEMGNGTLGSGKSLTGSKRVVEKAALNEAYIKREMQLLKPEVRKFRQAHDYESLRHYREIKEAYTFFKKHEKKYAWCLFSNIKITLDNGLRSHYLSIEHIMQIKRLPSFVAALLDEVQFFIDIDLFKDKTEVNDRISIIFRFFRHFFGNNALLILCEQDGNNCFINIRRVVSKNNTFSNMQKVLEPMGLIKKLDKLDIKMQKQGYPEILITKYRALEKRIRQIGFLTFDFLQENSKEGSIRAKEDCVMCFDSDLGYSYNDRAFEYFYNCKFSKLGEIPDSNKSYIVPSDVTRLVAMKSVKQKAPEPPKKSKEALALEYDDWIEDQLNAYNENEERLRIISDFNKEVCARKLFVQDRLYIRKQLQGIKYMLLAELRPKIINELIKRMEIIRNERMLDIRRWIEPLNNRYLPCLSTEKVIN